MTDDQQTLSDFSETVEESDPDSTAEEYGIFTDFVPEAERAAQQDDTADGEPEPGVVSAFAERVDPKLIDAGWGFESAKSVEYGKTEQSLLNHVRTGVFGLVQANEIVAEFDPEIALDAADLRDAIALFTIHDCHKLEGGSEQSPKDEFDIPLERIERLVDQFNLLEFVAEPRTASEEKADSEAGTTAPLSYEDFHSCAVDHHDSWNKKSELSTRRFGRLRPHIRLADALASSPTPESATNRRTRKAMEAAYPRSGIDLRYHTLDDVKGVFTNLLNAALADELETYGYRLLAIYQDGCVYLAPESAESPDMGDSFVKSLVDRLSESIRGSHPAYRDPTKLIGNLTTRSQGFYGINNQDFFYTGPEQLLRAVVRKAEDDADPDDKPTDSMMVTMQALDRALPVNIETDTHRVPGYARLGYTVRRAFVDPLVDAGIAEDSLAATCDLFGLSSELTERLNYIESGEVVLTDGEGNEVSLTGGGKWDYAYAIGQAIVDEFGNQPSNHRIAALSDRLLDSLADLDPEWASVVEETHAGQISTEVEAYVSDVIRIDGETLPPSNSPLSDAFEEYHNTRRGKSCTFCNRGTTSTRKSDMEAPKSLTTFQAGFSNRIPVDGGKPDYLYACMPCQVEFSLRETGSRRREAGRLFVHLVPDYFYTPLSWRAYDRVFQRYTGESRTRIGRLAEAVFEKGRSVEGHRTIASELARDEGGRSMIESLSQGFAAEKQFGTQTLGFFKPKDNDTEYQFFGTFLALAFTAYTGLRAYVSESPVPDVRGRDFDSTVKIGAGFSAAQRFFGSEVPLSAFESRLKAAAALVRLGYGIEQSDTLFAKHLRVTRNKPLPGSYLLKRIAQADDSRDVRYLLEEALWLDEHTGLVTESHHTDEQTAVRKGD
jgi:CRISPR-associated protein Csc3